MRPLAEIDAGWVAIVGGVFTYATLAGFGAATGSERQIDEEPRAARRPVGNFNGTGMLLNDTVAHRKPQARAFAQRPWW